MPPQNSPYLESKVLTAPPHRLHLMLIEGAIRFGRLAEKELAAGNRAAAAAPLLRLLDIVGEMLAGVRGNNSELNDKLAAVYWYIFRRSSEATMESNAAALAEVLKLLEFERETWLKVCEKLGSSSNASTATLPPIHAINADQSSSSTTGLSLQA
jgi:flagellar protein FliS